MACNLSAFSNSKYRLNIAIMIFSGLEINSNRSHNIFGTFLVVSFTYSSGLSKL